MKTFATKGFELAVSTLIIIIIGIVMLGMGVFIFMKAMSGAEEVSTTVDQGMKQLIEREMMGSSMRVAIPFVSKDIERNKLADFYMGIENVYDNEHTFKVSVMPVTPAVGDDENQPHHVIAGNILKVKPHERAYIRLNFLAPSNAPLKQYQYIINVCYDDDPELNDRNPEAPCNDNTWAFYDSGRQNFYPPKQMVYLKVK